MFGVAHTSFCIRGFRKRATRGQLAGSNNGTVWNIKSPTSLEGVGWHPLLVFRQNHGFVGKIKKAEGRGREGRGKWRLQSSENHNPWFSPRVGPILAIFPDLCRYARQLADGHPLCPPAQSQRSRRIHSQSVLAFHHKMLTGSRPNNQ